MSKDRHENNILQESLQKLEQQQQKGEEGFEKDEEKGEEEEAVASRKDEEEEEEAVASKKDEEEEECKTPTSSDHKIPTIQSCPPTPKKQKVMRVNLHKRKLSELQFFETTRSEEVESFFRSNSEPFTTTVEPRSIIKRRCRSA